MLHLSKNAGRNIREARTARLSVNSAKTSKIALLGFNRASILEPSRFVHRLGKYDFRSNPLG